MNLISFPVYTCGAILCDMLNNERSPVGVANNFDSKMHNAGKVGILRNLHNVPGSDAEVFKKRTNKLFHLKEYENKWIGTHCILTDIDASRFNKIINITTISRQSSLYQYSRIFWTHIHGQMPGKKHGKPKVIKHLESDCVQKVDLPNVTNIEFEDFVEWKNGIDDILLNLSEFKDQNHIAERRKAWTEVNNFLFDENKMNYVFKEWSKVNP